MKWIATAAAIVAVFYFVGVVASIPLVDGGTEPWWLTVVDNLAFVSFVLLPASVVIAVLRYRLYEIDVVISKAIVYGALAAFVTAAYVGIVVGLGHLIGSERSLPLQIAATVVVAVAFQPLRERVQRFANRLVYGRRATPYEVLARFAEQVAGTYSTDEIAAALARLLVDGTGARVAEIWVTGEGTMRLEAIWPEDAERSPSLPADDELTRVARVVHRGETLGHLAIRKAASEPIGPSDQKLLEDVAAQAGLVLRNVRLVDDLRASRQRLVAARDAERRKLERNIHDGAQQRLVALAVLYNMAAGLAKPLGEGRQAAIADLGAQANVALETLRDLARGIYPAVLSDGGLVPALEGQARKSPVPVEVEADGVGRYGQDVEAAVYFCCLEALQNVAKYAEATVAIVRLSEIAGEIRFEVRDDGIGFDPAAVDAGLGMRNMDDRIAAIGGMLDVRSSPGGGTTIAGRVPVPRGSRTLEVVG
jgi:signal transduction histidine kinase